MAFYRDADLLLGVTAPPPCSALEPRIEIARSFSYKMNVGNYESRDFFASAKKECAQSEAEEVAAQLYEFCKKQVLASVNQARKEHL